MGKQKVFVKQSLLRKMELLATGGLFIAMGFMGKNIAKAATVPVAPASPEPAATSKANVVEEITQKLQKMAEFAKSNKLTVIEFGAKWCEPCQRLSEAINNVKENYRDQVDFVQVDIDDPASQELQQKYNVGAVPAVFYIGKDGEVIHQTVGFGGQDWFVSQLNTFTRTKVAQN